MPFGRMMDIDVKSTLENWDKKPGEPEKPPEGEPAPGGGDQAQAPSGETRADEIADNNLGDASLEHELRVAAQRPRDEAAERQALIDGMNGQREKEKDEKEIKMAPPEIQSAIASTVRASLVLNNVQRLVAIRNQANFKKGLEKSPGEALKKTIGKGQMSTLQIPTVLLQRVQQEIGGMSSRTSQNDQMTGFLYWYFGQPDGVIFASDETAEKIQEIVERLGRNASPSKLNERSVNVSDSILEKLSDIEGRMGNMAALLALVSKDGMGVKVRADKTFLAMCYLTLNMLMLAPPVSPGQRPEDIDLLAGGAAWGLMSGIDEAYEYFKDTNGREIYKAKHGLKATQYRPPVQVSSRSDVQDYTPPAGMYGPQDTAQEPEDDDDDYEDIPEGFDPLNDDFDDMGIGANADDPALSDPEYDDGIEEGTPAYMKKKREEAMLRERIANMETGKEWNENGDSGS